MGRAGIAPDPRPLPTPLAKPVGIEKPDPDPEPSPVGKDGKPVGKDGRPPEAPPAIEGNVGIASPVKLGSCGRAAAAASAENKRGWVNEDMVQRTVVREPDRKGAVVTVVSCCCNNESELDVPWCSLYIFEALMESDLLMPMMSSSGVCLGY